MSGKEACGCVTVLPESLLALFFFVFLSFSKPPRLVHNACRLTVLISDANDLHCFLIPFRIFKIPECSRPLKTAATATSSKIVVRFIRSPVSFFKCNGSVSHSLRPRANSDNCVSASWYFFDNFGMYRVRERFDDAKAARFACPAISRTPCRRCMGR